MTSTSTLADDLGVVPNTVRRWAQRLGLYRRLGQGYRMSWSETEVRAITVAIHVFGAINRVIPGERESPSLKRAVRAGVAALEDVAWILATPDSVDCGDNVEDLVAAWVAMDRPPAALVDVKALTVTISPLPSTAKESAPQVALVDMTPKIEEAVDYLIDYLESHAKEMHRESRKMKMMADKLRAAMRYPPAPREEEL